MELRKTSINLFTKFSLGISLTVLIFGALNIIIVRNSVTNSLNQEFEKRGYFISRTLSEQSVGFILQNNTARLNLLVNEIKAIDPTLYYAFILNSQREVLAHTFNFPVPNELIIANIPQPGQEFSTVMITQTDEPGLLIRDFAMPVLSPDLGFVRVGILEDEIRRQVAGTLEQLLVMIVVFLILGVLGALFFSYTIATPLKELSQHSEFIDIKNIQAGIEKIKASTSDLHNRLRRIFNKDDEIDVLYHNYLDMLQRLDQAHHKMNQLQQSLFQAEKMASIGTLTAGIAHEINNPLAGIRIGLTRIERNPKNLTQIKEYTSMMKQALSRAEHVIKDLLTFSRKSHLELESVNACEIIRKTVQLANYRIKNQKIQINILPSECPVMINVSQNRIEQVFLNLIINGLDAVNEKLKHRPGSEGKVDISVYHQLNCIHIRFSDNGIGIEQSNLPKIFDPFFTTKDVGEGTGLGLAVSYQIVKDHGGEITVDSHIGQGSIFEVILPQKQKRDKLQNQ
jgi:two-component system, NtrC family, sensor kinase